MKKINLKKNIVYDPFKNEFILTLPKPIKLNKVSMTKIIFRIDI